MKPRVTSKISKFAVPPPAPGQISERSGEICPGAGGGTANLEIETNPGLNPKNKALALGSARASQNVNERASLKIEFKIRPVQYTNTWVRNLNECASLKVWLEVRVSVW